MFVRLSHNFILDTIIYHSIWQFFLELISIAFALRKGYYYCLQTFESPCAPSMMNKNKNSRNSIKDILTPLLWIEKSEWKVMSIDSTCPATWSGFSRPHHRASSSEKGELPKRYYVNCFALFTSRTISNRNIVSTFRKKALLEFSVVDCNVNSGNLFVKFWIRSYYRENIPVIGISCLKWNRTIGIWRIFVWIAGCMEKLTSLSDFYKCGKI